MASSVTVRMGITSCHYRLHTAIILLEIARVRAHTRFIMSARGNDASYTQGGLEIAPFESIARSMNVESFLKDMLMSKLK